MPSAAEKKHIIYLNWTIFVTALFARWSQDGGYAVAPSIFTTLFAIVFALSWLHKIKTVFVTINLSRESLDTNTICWIVPRNVLSYFLSIHRKYNNITQQDAPYKNKMLRNVWSKIQSFSGCIIVNTYVTFW